MKKVIILKGLPASGKTTWAKEQLAKNPGMYKRINKDDLRSMLDGGKWSKDNEKMVLEVRDELIIRALSAGKHVIIDDTNLHHKHELNIRRIVDDWNKGRGDDVRVEIKWFLCEPQECINRDLARPNSVGAKVILDMYNKYIITLQDGLTPPKEKVVYTPPPGKPKAIIVDIDGTIALMNGKRGPYDWDKVGLDDVNEPIVSLIEKYCVGGQENSDFGWPNVILVSGRDGSCKEATELWLKENEIYYHALHLRPTGDTRKDYIIKQEIFNEHIRDHYDVQFVLDDRPQVIRMWRSLGLFVLDCGPGVDF